jgi:hypothetical protein
LYIFNGALVNQISCNWACQESYKLRHGVYAVGLLDGDEIADRIGWSVGREGIQALLYRIATARITQFRLLTQTV